MMTKISDETGKVIFALLGVMVVVGAAFFVSGPSSSPSSGDVEAQFNRADIMFMTMMVPHHNQAIEMAEMAPKRTDNEKIHDLSENISTSQRQENQQMREWLEEAGYEPSSRAGMMAGMATPEELAQLEQSQGDEFDQLFAELMIDHHEGGIHMASMEVQNGRSEKVRELAQGMIETQRKEIGQMESITR